MKYIFKFAKKFLASLIVFFLLLTGPQSLALAQQNQEKRVDVFIGFTQTPGPSERALVRNAGGAVKHSYHLVPAIAASIPESAIAGLSQNPNVTGIELDGLVYAVDAELENAWGVNRIGSGTVHEGSNKGIGVKIGIIDSGVDYRHQDLDGVYAGGYDFVQNDADPDDVYGHGTHVAGTACAEDNGSGVVGVAPECALYSLRVLNDSGSGSWNNVVAALEWAVDNGIQVTNNSYGAGSDPGSTVKAAFDNSAAAGILHVAAAGNSGNQKGNNDSVIYPAKYESVVAVAATNKNDTRPSWSSTGPAVELAAPGVSVLSSWNDGDSPHDQQPFILDGDWYKEGSGTSMASPHVAGVAALVIAAGISDANGNGLINDEVRQVLNDTAEDLGDTGRDNKYGWGLVSAAAAVAAVGPVDQLPVVSITNPLEGGIVFGTVLITADATDDDGVISVDFYIDGVLLNSDTVSPYEVSWDTTTATEGARLITATATDTASQTNSADINVTVDNINDSPVADAGADQTVSDNDGDGLEAVTLDGSGSYDPDGTVVYYNWYKNGALLGSGATLTVDFTLGTHTVTLTVTDNDGAAASDDVVITVVEAPDISLTATGYKVKGLQKADLDWSGANTTNVDVYRDSVLVATTANDGVYTDNIDQRGNGAYVYQLCEEGTTTCSNESTAIFN